MTRETLIEEIRALLDLASLKEYELREAQPYTLELKVRECEVRSVLGVLCRSAFIKRIEHAETGIIQEFGREFTCRPRPLKKINTASAPLEPAISRLLVNLARVRPGYKVLDPFSGVGGILFEAALVGAHVVGQDIEIDYVKTLSMNIPLLSDTISSDSSQSFPLRNSSIDAVVSDPPYAKLSLVDLDLDYVYYNALRECARVLKGGKYLAWTCIASIRTEDFAEEVGLEVIHVGYQCVHRSLVRKIVVARKPCNYY